MKFCHDFSHSGALRLLAGLAHQYGFSIYVRSGPPQLFERLDISACHTFAHSWLYVPLQYSKVALEQLSCGTPLHSGEVTWLDPFSIDDHLVYPVARCNEIVAAVATSDSRCPDIAPQDKDQIASALAVIQESADADVRQLSRNFVQELFHRDNSVTHFMKRLLGLLITEWPRSCAGLYTEVEGVYQLRLATGDVSRWHCLPGQLNTDATMRYLESMYRQAYFVAADTTPDYPVLLDSAPDFIFIHEGVLSERSKQLIVMAGPGTLATLCVNRLLEYLGLLGETHELQFAHGLELLRSYDQMAGKGLGASAGKVLQDTFDWLSQQVSISCLTLVHFGDDNRITADIAGRVPSDVSAGGYSPSIPPVALESIRNGHPWHVASVQEADYGDNESRGRLGSNVLSELYVPLISPDGVRGALIVGSPAPGEYLKDCEEILSSVAAYFSIWLQTSQPITRLHPARVAASV